MLPLRCYALANAFRRRGRQVVLGGPHATLLPAEAVHADAVVVGEAERTWPQVIEDAARGQLRSLYRDSEPPSLKGLPHCAARPDPQPRAAVQHGGGNSRLPAPLWLLQSAADLPSALRFRPVEEVVAEVRTFRRGNSRSGTTSCSWTLDTRCGFSTVWQGWGRATPSRI